MAGWRIMADSDVRDLVLSDLIPVVRLAAAKFHSKEQVASIASLSEVYHVRYPTERADEIELWTAVFEAAMDEPPETLGLLLNNIVKTPRGVAKSDMENALGKVGISCLSRITRAAHPDLGDQVDSLLEAADVPGMEGAAKELRRTALNVRRLLMRPVLANACIKIAPTVLDPERRRLELADLAVDVVTATDYLLSLLDSPLSPSAASSLERGLGPERGHSAPDSDSRDRMNRRRYDALGFVAKQGMRLLEGLRSDVATL